MILLRRVIGDALRARRQSQHRTLREVSTAANVSLGYLSEIERGQKEASSELLAAICDALGAQLSELLREVSHTVATAERTDLVPAGTRSPAAGRATLPGSPPSGSGKTGPVQTGPARSGPAQTGPTQTGPARSGPAQTGPTQTGPARSGPAQSAPVRPGPVRPGPARPGRATPEPATASAATRAITPGEGTDFRANAAGIVLPHAHRKITVDGDVAVAVLQSTPLKATLRTTHNSRSPKRGREVALSH